MFGKHLKSYRKQLGMTQNQASTLLNLVGGDLSNIDAVAISRWERGTIEPSTKRCIRILREFSNNILPYLSELSREQRKGEISNRVSNFNVKMLEKYHSVDNLINTTNYYQHQERKGVKKLCEKTIETGIDDRFVMDLHNYHDNVSNGESKHNVQTIDLMHYLEDERLIAFKYVDCASNTLVGHNLGAIYKPEVLENEISDLRYKTISDIDLKKTTPYKEKGAYSYFAFSQHSLSEQAFRLQLYREFNYLAQRANIKHYYTSVALKSSVDILEKMGFTAVAYEDKCPVGAIKVGKERYSRAIMYCETSDLFSQAEFLDLLTKCGDCGSPCLSRQEAC